MGNQVSEIGTSEGGDGKDNGLELVLFGRGGQVQNHPGTKVYRQKVKDMLPDWRAAESDEDKDAVVNSIIKGKRFFIDDKGTQSRRELNREDVWKRVKKSLQDAVRAEKEKGAETDLEYETIERKDLTPNDAVVAMGGFWNTYEPSMRLRDMIEEKKPDHHKSKSNLEKQKINSDISSEWKYQDPPGRILTTLPGGDLREMTEQEKEIYINKTILRAPRAKKAANNTAEEDGEGPPTRRERSDASMKLNHGRACSQEVDGEKKQPALPTAAHNVEGGGRKTAPRSGYPPVTHGARRAPKGPRADDDDVNPHSSKVLKLLPTAHKAEHSIWVMDRSSDAFEGVNDQAPPGVAVETAASADDGSFETDVSDLMTTLFSGDPQGHSETAASADYSSAETILSDLSDALSLGDPQRYPAAGNDALLHDLDPYNAYVLDGAAKDSEHFDPPRFCTAWLCQGPGKCLCFWV